MIKRLSLLLAALFVASMVLVAPVFASGSNGDDNGNANHNEKVCVLDNGGDEDYKWVSEHGNHHGDKVVKDKFCEHKDNNGDDNNDHHGKANNDDDNGHTNNNGDDDNGNNGDDGDDWS